jgi:membrane-bound lytic murein transglycosylase MltF
MLQRGQIRFLVVYDKMFYFLDAGTQRGITYELVKRFEQELNGSVDPSGIRVQAIFVPLPRDQLVPALLEGRGDVAAANLKITTSRRALVDFSEPLLTGLEEVVVTRRDGPPLGGLEDLAGRTVWVRVASTHHESLQRLNARFAAEGRRPINLVPVAPFMEDSDLLAMVDAGLVPAAVVDRHRADLWADVLQDVAVRRDLVVGAGRETGWAFRKGSPRLAAAVDGFVRRHREGTLYGNLLFTRYLEHNRWVRNRLDEREVTRFRAVVELFKDYAGQYELDWLMLAALAFQESGLDHGKESPRGAVGIMQLLPSTARDPNVGIADIGELERNIHAGTKYLRFLYDRYFAGEPMEELDKMLFSFAAYNAGPARVRRLRDEARRMGLDPNRWFRHVEVAAAAAIGQETVQYVANVYKYYTAYRLVADRLAERPRVRRF